MDKETIQLVASAAASAAASQLGRDLRDELKTQFAEAKLDLKRDLQAYFGEQTAAKHVVHHDRLERFLVWSDRATQSFWGQVGKNLIYVALGAAALIWAAPHLITYLATNAK
jgi:hypothetical protein